MNTIGVTDHVVTGKELKGNVIPGAISYALKIGQDLRKANEDKVNAAKYIAQHNNGKLLFRGLVNKFSWDTIDGFTIGDTFLDGIDEYKGNSYHIWFKNENIIAYLNEQVDVTIPDLICIVDKDGNPVLNPYFENGMEVSVFALPAPKEWTTPKGLETFSPTSFGFDFKYSPFKK